MNLQKIASSPVELFPWLTAYHVKLRSLIFGQNETEMSGTNLFTIVDDLIILIEQEANNCSRLPKRAKRLAVLIQRELFGLQVFFHPSRYDGDSAHVFRRRLVRLVAAFCDMELKSSCTGLFPVAQISNRIVGMLEWCRKAEYDEDFVCEVLLQMSRVIGGHRDILRLVFRKYFVKRLPVTVDDLQLIRYTLVYRAWASIEPQPERKDIYCFACSALRIKPGGITHPRVLDRIPVTDDIEYIIQHVNLSVLKELYDNMTKPATTSALSRIDLTVSTWSILDLTEDENVINTADTTKTEPAEEEIIARVDLTEDDEDEEAESSTVSLKWIKRQKRLASERLTGHNKNRLSIFVAAEDLASIELEDSESESQTKTREPNVSDKIIASVMPKRRPGRPRKESSFKNAAVEKVVYSTRTTKLPTAKFDPAVSVGKEVPNASDPTLPTLLRAAKSVAPRQSFAGMGAFELMSRTLRHERLLEIQHNGIPVLVNQLDFNQLKSPTVVLQDVLMLVYKRRIRMHYKYRQQLLEQARFTPYRASRYVRYMSRCNRDFVETNFENKTPISELDFYDVYPLFTDLPVNELHMDELVIEKRNDHHTLIALPEPEPIELTFSEPEICPAQLQLISEEDFDEDALLKSSSESSVGSSKSSRNTSGTSSIPSNFCSSCASTAPSANSSNTSVGVDSTQDILRVASASEVFHASPELMVGPYIFIDNNVPLEPEQEKPESAVLPRVLSSLTEVAIDLKLCGIKYMDVNPGSTDEASCQVSSTSDEQMLQVQGAEVSSSTETTDHIFSDHNYVLRC